MNPGGARYQRQRLLGVVGYAGQARLAASSAVVIGCGALGTVIADGLARAGVGRLVLVDRDVVEVSNLQRQTLFDTQDAAEGTPKVIAAARRLRAVNPECAVVPVIADVSGELGERVLDVGWAVERARGDGAIEAFEIGATTAGGRASVVIDGTDNFETRYLLNDLCVKHGVPLVYGGAVGTGGTVMAIVPGTTACLRCVFPDAPAAGTSPTCDTVGVLAAAAGVIGNMQAAAALRLMVGSGEEAWTPRLVSVDVWGGVVRSVGLEGARDPACVCCGGRRFEYLEADATRGGAVTLCGAGAVQIGGGVGTRLELAAVHARLARVGASQLGAYFVRARPEGSGVELTIFRDGRAIVRGTEDVSRARAVYSRFVGG